MTTISYYKELPNISIDLIIEFSKYIIENRTIVKDEGDIVFNIFKPLKYGEELPEILFSRSNPDDSHINIVYNYTPPLLMIRMHDGKMIDGIRVEPLFNLESKLNKYYQKG